jgi:lipoprotein-anchoring transpeptidase ErfK/SrfK
MSLKSHNKIKGVFIDHLEDYQLQLSERNGITEIISVKNFGIQYNETNGISDIYKIQNSYEWITSLFNEKNYYINDLFVYNNEIFNNKINELSCLNQEIIKPKNVSFEYMNGSYKIIKEVWGNEINRDSLESEIKCSILKGERYLDLNKKNCYENPKYTLTSDKTMETFNILNKYIKAKITYLFGSRTEVLDKKTINEWIIIDKNVDVYIDENKALNYVKKLSKKYDTMGVSRNFKTSTGKTVEVKGGTYGWKMDLWSETQSMINNIILGGIIEKEPIYIQTAHSREENDIGDTYVEINITKQHLWFYKNGKLLVHGSIVSGNPNKGNQTVLGTYMLNYKQKNAALTGEDYETNVNYWMPFFGNIGIHDASWRYAFGKEIYKNNGSHGCVNVPLNVAKTIYENIEEGTPIICYEESF